MRLPMTNWPLARVHLAGVFALWSSEDLEPPGSVGATVQLLRGEESCFRLDLVNGRHYRDGQDTSGRSVLVGDGASIETLGAMEVDGELLRFDLLTLDVPEEVSAETLCFRDRGGPSSFVINDVIFEFRMVGSCPFHSDSGGVSLAELSGIVRVADRVKMSQAIAQLEAGLRVADDLDEARGEALTFLAVVTAGRLETGGSRELHRVQLEAARKLEAATTIDDIARVARRMIEEVLAPIFAETSAPSSYLIDQALELVERNFARPLTDSSVAQKLGLSTSHFRYLFRQATGQPFHKYVMALRLEKARAMLIEQDVPVGEVARAVGFGGLSHFSRAFAQRFAASPSELRRSVQ
ncbi:MAG TPA: AraC family transcriptional regulator [Fimbriimonadaceae bacterium]|nr:AraC family transcriptional regulator [Fimbriimonadaceae bacterium]